MIARPTSLRGAELRRTGESTIDGRDHRRRADDLEAEVEALRAEVKRLREQLLHRAVWRPGPGVYERVRSGMMSG